ncbi:MAG: late competence development ComFB family protein [Pseudanabaenaceae cyanobacterium]
MYSLKNAIEDIVVEEAIRQLTAWPGLEAIAHTETTDDRGNLLSRVAVRALNQLPPQYATSDRGWSLLRRKASHEMSREIAEAVRQALQAEWADQTPTTERPPNLTQPGEFDNPARVLAQMQELLGDSTLQWRDVASAVERHLDNIRYGGLDTPAPVTASPVRFLPPTPWKEQKWRWESSEDPNLSAGINAAASAEAFASYMLPAACFFTNALEQPVATVIQKQLQHLAPDLVKNVRLEDMVAYTLNRLPPKYVASADQLHQVRQEITQQMSTDIWLLATEAILKMHKAPRRLVRPLPLAQFEVERERAIADLRLVLQRDDIDWRNAVVRVQEAIEAAKLEGSDWRQRWQMLGHIYKELQLAPGDAELSLYPVEGGEVLVIQTHSRHVFGKLADGPRDIALSALRFFPDLTAIELSSPLLGFRLSYSREEMVSDGVFTTLGW